MPTEPLTAAVHATSLDATLSWEVQCGGQVNACEGGGVGQVISGLSMKAT